MNDDSTADSWGDTCSSWYDDLRDQDLLVVTGAYDDDDFIAATHSVVLAKVLNLMVETKL